uniref:hypothetical protein n=1 Tax=Flavobacterium sp. TaxID=239 RepID=UPI004049AB6B
MAKFDGIFNIEGTIQGMSFYKTKNGESLIRKKGGVSKNRIMSDPAFQRTRENGEDFKHAANMGRLLRSSVANLVSLAKDNRMSSRLFKALSLARNADTTSARGNRKVWIGLQTNAGKEALKGFDFNVNSSFLSVLKAQPTLDPLTGTVSILEFNPESNLMFPEGATHASFRVAVANVDFELANYGVTYSPVENFALQNGSLDLTLTPTGMPSGSGTTFYYFLIAFFQEFNGVQYPLKNNAHNVLYIMDVV